MPLIEVAFGCYMSCCVFFSLYWGWGRGSIPFLLIFAGGYFYVGVGSLMALRRMNQEAYEEIEAAQAVST